MLSDEDKKVLKIFADCDMNISWTARRMSYSRSDIVYKLDQIVLNTGLDPRRYNHLVKLMENVNNQ